MIGGGGELNRAPPLNSEYPRTYIKNLQNLSKKTNRRKWNDTRGIEVKYSKNNNNLPQKGQKDKWTAPRKWQKSRGRNVFLLQNSCSPTTRLKLAA